MVTKRASPSASNAAPKRCAMRRTRAGSPLTKFLTSAPALKNFSPLPVMTAADTDRSALSRPTMSCSSASPSAVKVLAGGLARRSVAMAPSRVSSIMVSGLVGRVGLAHQIDDGGEVLAARAARAPELVELLGGGAEHHRLARLARGIGGEGEVLEHEVGAEAAGVAARGGRVLEHPRIGVVGIRAPAASARGVDDAGEHLGVDAERGAETHGLGHADHGDAEQQVVADLRHLTGARAAAMHDRLAHGREHRLHALEK